jgi:hypothetical protein
MCDDGKHQMFSFLISIQFDIFSCFQQDFANQAESIFKGSDRHTHLDKSYKTLVVVIYEQIARVANESQKTPKDVVMMGRYFNVH